MESKALPHVVTVFISHSWTYSEHYEKLSSWIFDEPWSVDGVPLSFVNSSVPKDDPIHKAPNSMALKQSIFSLIYASDVVVIPTGMYATYSEWIGKEIDGSQQFGKPILAVDLWAAERKSSVVGDAASETVGWNKQSVVNGIWRLGGKS